jgi:putative Holliday junction resolvase
MSTVRKILAIDPGRVRLGLAISDVDRKFSFPLETYTRRDPAKDLAHLRALVTEEGIALLLVGLPIHNDGREGDSAREARALGDWLGGELGLPVRYFDERFTTVEAESILWEAGLTHRQRKERRDRVAAQILLQTFLDAGCPERDPEPDVP